MKNNILITINNNSDYNYDVYGYIIGIKSFSINFSKYYDINEIDKLKDKIGNKKLYISLNRLIFNDELIELTQLLKDISKLNIDGVFFSDLSIYNIVNKLKLDIKLIFNQEYFINNYLTCNWYYNKNIKDIVISNEITNSDLKLISKNTKVNIYKKVFGYLKLSTSKREFISSYLKHIKLNKNIKSGFIKDNDTYRIIEDKYGSYIFSDKIYMLNKNSFIDKVNYYIIDTYLIKSNIIKNIMGYYFNTSSNIPDKLDVSTYFSENKTMFKVKK